MKFLRGQSKWILIIKEVKVLQLDFILHHFREVLLTFMVGGVAFDSVHVQELKYPSVGIVESLDEMLLV